jgi:dTDP-glucose pyrophosphorylase
VAKEFIGAEDFLLTYGDILVRPDNYRRILARFRERSFSGLVTVTAGEDVTKGGINFFDDDFCLTRLVEKPSPAQLEELRSAGLLKTGAKVWYNAGIYVFRPVVYDFTARLQKSVRGEYELTDALNGMINAGHKVAGLAIEGRWVDVRDPEVLRGLQTRETEG